MEALKKNLPLVLFFAILVLVFKVWFLPGIVTGGDFWPGYSSMNGNISLYPYAWHWEQNSGIGGNAIGLLWFFTTSAIFTTIFGTILHFPVELVERFGFFYPYLIISFLSFAYLSRKIFLRNNFWILSPLIFILNTYILMVVGGGQIFIMLSYALSPLVIYSFLRISNYPNRYESSLISSIVAGLVLTMQIMFDIRIAYISLFAVGLYWILNVFNNRNLRYLLSSLLFVFVIPGIIAISLHAFWLLSTIVIGQNPLSQLGSGFTTASAVQFFSFARLENSVALLHPNWPENIFGKTYFMKPEFLLIPIVAFVSLLFVKKLKNSEERLYIIYFTLLALIGAFLSKGTNDPLGGIYLWMFNHVPGFIMFRDPTKWYMLVAISYSILIPFSIWNIYGFLNSKLKTKNSKVQVKIQKFIPSLFLILVASWLLFLIRPALEGKLKGTLSSHSIPRDYIKLEEFLSTQSNFSRTLLLPVGQRYIYYSGTHPEVAAQDFFKLTDTAQVVNKLKNANTEILLQQSAIKYLIVPYDSEGEIFLKDRKYDEGLYKTTLTSVSKISYLKRIDGFGKIGVFEISNPKDHFWSPSKSLSLEYKYISPVEYLVNVKNAKKGDTLVFVENYGSKWAAENSEVAVESLKFDNKFNSFVLPADGNYSLRIYYTPQDYVNIGVGISVVSLFIIFGTLVILIIKKR